MAYWYMNGQTRVDAVVLPYVQGDRNWNLVGVGYFGSPDQYADFLWYNTATAQVYVWHMAGTTAISDTLVTGARCRS